MSKTKNFINKYKRKGINYPTGKNYSNDQREIDKCPAYISEHNSAREKHFIFVMIMNGDGRHQRELSCSKKTISIIKRNKLKKQW